MSKNPRIVTRLSVNLNKVALLRNQRDLNLPSVEAAACTVLEAGARGITIHPRPDRRHALAEDAYRLREVVDGYGAELNIEGNPTVDFLSLVADVAPHQVTLVPDDPSARTSDHGWDLCAHEDFLAQVTSAIKGHGSRVSVFVDCDAPVAKAAELGADAVELYTEPYAQAHLHGQPVPILAQFSAAAQAALQAGLIVHAGHDLSLENLREFLMEVPDVTEVSIGHAFSAESLWLGMEETTKRYLQIIQDLC